jgi:hypothetical protein
MFSKVNMDEVDLLQRAIKLLSKHQRRAAASHAHRSREREIKNSLDQPLGPLLVHHQPFDAAM